MIVGLNADREYYEKYNLNCKHHASGQLLINYILHKNNMIKSSPRQCKVDGGWVG